MKPLVMDAGVVVRFKEIKKYAKAHYFDLATMRKAVDGEIKLAPGDNPSYSMGIHVGFKLVFTIEEHPFGWANHVSISVSGSADRRPSVVAVNCMLKDFLGVAIKDACNVWDEKLEDGGGAINLLFHTADPRALN